MEAFVSVAVTAATVGLGCGSVCGSSAAAFLSSYILTQAGGFRAGLRYVLSFFFGKLTAVVAVCVAASALGRVFIDESGFVGGIDLNAALPWTVLATAVFLIVRWFLEGRGCARCHGCREKAPRGRFAALPALLVGFGYGITPCAPLLLVAGYAVAFGALRAAALGAVFSAASSLTPLLLIAVLSGFLSSKIEGQLGKALRYLRLALYLTFLGMAVFSLV